MLFGSISFHLLRGKYYAKKELVISCTQTLVLNCSNLTDIKILSY